MSFDFINEIATGSSPVIGIMSLMILFLSVAVIYQWRYLKNDTVSIEVWEQTAGKIDQIVKQQEKLLVIIKERLNNN